MLTMSGIRFSAARAGGQDGAAPARCAGTRSTNGTFRTRGWTGAVKASGVDFNVRIHDLRHAHGAATLRVTLHP